MANPAFWSGGDIPWISSKEVVGGVLTDTERKVTRRAVQETSLRLTPPGSVAVVVRSGILLHTFPVALVPFETTVNQDIKIGTPRHGVLAEYLAYCVHAHGQPILDRCRKTGTTVQSVDVQGFLAFEVPLLPLPVQRRIVDLIGALDAQIEALVAEASEAQQVHEGLAEKLIVGTMTTVQEIAEGRRGLVGGPFGSSLATKHYAASGIPVIRGINMPKVGRFVGGEFVFVSPDKAASLSSNLAKPGGVIFTQRGTLGQVGLVPDDYPTLVVSQSQMRLRVDPSRAVAEYVYFAFSRPSVVRAMQQQNTATANPHINLGILAKQQMPVPDLGEQERLVNLLLASSEIVDALHAEIAAAQAARRVILGLLLDGQVQIPDTYDALLAAL